LSSTAARIADMGLLEHLGASSSWSTMPKPDAVWKPPMVFCARASWMPWSSATDESTEDFFVLLLKWMGVWFVLWYVFAGLVHVFVMPRLPESSKPHENKTVYVSQKFVAEIKSVAVSLLANVGVFQMWGQAGVDLYAPNVYAEFAGILFTSFEGVDLVLGSLHGFMDAVYVAHHAIHIALGLIIRGNCTLGFPAAILMSQDAFCAPSESRLPLKVQTTALVYQALATSNTIPPQETSSVFLNYYLMTRNRVAHWSVGAAQKLFALAFFAWRLGLNTYGTVHFVRYYRDDLYGGLYSTAVVPWQMHAMAALLVAACILQWYWGAEIVKMALRPPKPLKKKSPE